MNEMYCMDILCTYLSKLYVQDADSIIKAVDIVLEKTKANEQMLKYTKDNPKKSTIKGIFCTKPQPVTHSISKFSPPSSTVKADDTLKQVHVAIINAKSEEDIAITVKDILLRLRSKLSITILQEPKTEQQTHHRLKILDEVDMAVALLSPRYL